MKFFQFLLGWSKNWGRCLKNLVSKTPLVNLFIDAYRRQRIKQSLLDCEEVGHGVLSLHCARKMTVYQRNEPLQRLHYNTLYVYFNLLDIISDHLNFIYVFINKDALQYWSNFEELRFVSALNAMETVHSKPSLQRCLWISWGHYPHTFGTSGWLSF